MSQADRLWEILSDGKPHRSDELVREVYGVGDGTWLARLGARIYDLKQKRSAVIVSWPDPDNKGRLWWYHFRGFRLVKNRETEANPVVVDLRSVKVKASATQGELPLSRTPWD